MNDTIEFFATIVVVVLALCIPPIRTARRDRWWGRPALRARLRRWRHSIRRSAILKKYGTAIVFSIVFAVAAAGALRGRYPEPTVQDEFAYLLAADTFERGRLANPTHPQWQHLESLHINWQPAYGSKYPPGQGLSLALGDLVFGEPIFGVWLGVAAAAAAIYWMLLAWFAPGWALVGTFIPTIRMLTLWTDNYWGGGLPALGGALLFGSLVRLLSDPRPRYGALLGAGLSILALTRPFFGLLAAIPAAAVVLVWLVRKVRSGDHRQVVHSLSPTALLLAATFAFTGLHNHRTTGDIFTMPHKLYERTYAIAGEFVLMPTREPPEYRHAEIRDHHVNYMLAPREAARERYGFNSHNWRKVRKVFKLLVGFAMALPLLAGLAFPFRREPWIRFAVLTCSIGVLGALAVVHYLPHYFAPFLAIAMLPLVFGMRQLRAWRWRGRPVGRRINAGLILLFAVAAAPVVGARFSESAVEQTDRGRVAERLEARPGNHLVVVRYGPNHYGDDEWVYNTADPDGSRIVWAREMDPVRNEELFRYFADRQIWLVEPDLGPRTLRPYSR